MEYRPAIGLGFTRRRQIGPLFIMGVELKMELTYRKNNPRDHISLGTFLSHPESMLRKHHPREASCTDFRPYFKAR